VRWAELLHSSPEWKQAALEMPLAGSALGVWLESVRGAIVTRSVRNMTGVGAMRALHAA
jgi:hypothetical protein